MRTRACGPRSCGAGFVPQKMFLLVLWAQISHRGTPGALLTKAPNCLLVSASVCQCLPCKGWDTELTLAEHWERIR